MYELNKQQIKSVEIFGRLAPAGLPIKIDDYTITNGYAIMRFKQPIPDEIEMTALDSKAARKLVEDIEQQESSQYQRLESTEMIQHPMDNKITLIKYYDSYYNKDIVDRVKRTLGGNEMFYQEIKINGGALFIRGLNGWGVIMPVRVLV